MKFVLSLVAALGFVSFFAQSASAQSTQQDRTTAQLQGEIQRIDSELNGTRVLVRRAFLPRNDSYQTILPTPARRAELLAQRNALEVRLSLRRSLMRGLMMGFNLGISSEQAILHDLRRMNEDAMNRR